MGRADQTNRWITFLRAAIAIGIIAGLAFYVLGYKRIAQRDRFANEILITAGGDGSQDNPFLIGNEEQFISFRDSVNRGYVYEGCYFLQTADLNLEQAGNWMPIGPAYSPFYFEGYYDGGGHTVRGIRCVGGEDSLNNVALFGQLSGTVINLGIADSTFRGENAASLVYTSSGKEAKIINCYSEADIVTRKAASGIAHTFSGYVVNCWYGGSVESYTTAAISAFNPASIYSCFGSEPLYTDGFIGFSYECRSDIFNKKDAFAAMNDNIADCAFYLRMEPEQFVVWG